MQSLARTAAFALSLVLPLASLGLQAAESIPVEQYHYGMQLDVQKVLALHEAPTVLCQVVEARMDYLDSQGREHRLAYLKHATACQDSN
ncbi:hypothetical protein thsps21_35400 [Pseudomonas sp. No.21]|jgi:hypothetical protein|uniref:DUF2790 domain-containing protein n=1 Tax=Pseudomonas TaxID=286 RepID=UPI000DA87D8D|nr:MULTISPECIES: DUF2790 domain-containing protein [Pseudomonas]MDW3715743.1 DUF2790 domain-containing protein [Pseudomonas sp. 2023EL-01195]PZE09736.1 DUF2790 domain-containing protein [Pseudomonas sp. 57B-090624]GJN45779.1 hypothetical protein TUM20249_17650 [Pseudomonas tohonis]